MNKKQYCYNCGRILVAGKEYDLCNKCALELEENLGDTHQQLNATRIQKRRKPSYE